MHAAGDPKSALDLARSAKTSSADLTALSVSEYVFVREAAAENASTPLAALTAMLPKSLGSDDDWRIAAALLRNPQHSEPLASALASLACAAKSEFVPRHFYARAFLEALARSPHASVEALGQLLDLRLAPKHVRQWLAVHTRRVDVATFLLRDPSGMVRSRAARTAALLVPPCGCHASRAAIATARSSSRFASLHGRVLLDHIVKSAHFAEPAEIQPVDG